MRNVINGRYRYHLISQSNSAQTNGKNLKSIFHFSFLFKKYLIFGISRNFFLKVNILKADVMVDDYNPCTWETEAEVVQCQVYPKLHSHIPSQKRIKTLTFLLLRLKFLPLLA